LRLPFGYAIEVSTYSIAKRPLFNDAAWAKADNVLSEILAGLAADPPGVNFYTQVRAQPLLSSHSQ
jgi:hypothetical protein